MSDLPTVDLVIPTIGRESLDTALLAACVQTYENTRVVVISDGPSKEVAAQYKWTAPAHRGRAIYRETPERFGHGNFVKEWWINHPEASPWIRFLDDDDWLPPMAMGEMMRHAADDVALIICQMVVTATGPDGYLVKSEVRGADLAKGLACTGTCLMRTEAARGKYPTETPADYNLAVRVAEHGRVVTVPHPLYWYLAYRGGKGPAVRDGEPYTGDFVWLPPQSFRKSLLTRVPPANLVGPDGEPLGPGGDEALFRALARRARRTARVDRDYYHGGAEETPESTAAREAIVARGFIPGDPAAPVDGEASPPVVVIIVGEPCERCRPSIERQQGDATIVGVPDFAAIIEAARALPENAIICPIDGAAFLRGDQYLATLAKLYADPDVEMTYGRGKLHLGTDEEAKLTAKAHTLGTELKSLRAALTDKALATERRVQVEARIGRVRASASKVKRALRDAGGFTVPATVMEWPELTGAAIDLIPTRLRWAAEDHTGEPRVAVVVPARNEGALVLPAVENLLAAGADELYLIDDASSDGSCNPRKLPGEINVIRNHEPEGVAESRNIGMDIAAGNGAGVLCTADAHVLGVPDALRLMARAAVDRHAIISAATRPMKRPKAWTAYGAALRWCQGAFVHPMHMSQADELSAITCLYGSVYAVPLHVWRRIGPWLRLREVGGNEQAMSLLAWFTGTPMLCHRDAIFQHHHKKARGEDHRNARLNVHMMAFALFEAETYREWFMPHLKYVRQKNDITDEAVLTDPLFIAERERVQPTLCRTDAEFFVEVVYAPVENGTLPSGRVDRDKDGF